MDKGLLATKPEIILGDVKHMEFRKAWRLSNQMLNTDEIASFKDMLRHFGD